MDDVDIANANIEWQLSTRLSCRVQHKGLSNRQCESCDNEIQQKRREAVLGVTLCIACAEIKESKQRQYTRS